jgi:cytochrome c2
MEAWMTRAWLMAVVAMTGAMLAAPGSAQQAQITGDAEAGAEIYAAQCKGCHTVSIAPTLRGVADRPIASVAGFGGYSDALKAKAVQTWTAQNLEAFLAAPAAFAPGTRMVMSVSDPQARADVIAYIRALPPPRNP